MRIESRSFRQGGEIPGQFTCEGGDVSPELSWSDVPAGAKSLALIVDDPDAPDPKAPKVVWVHWVVSNISPTAAGLAEGASNQAMPPGAREGNNDWNRPRYNGPCPPIGRHRYFFKLYALDTLVDAGAGATKGALETAMQGHILAQAELMGTYQKGQ
jgi:Raf kinase inhibitor-like YbhB/YbcL family protein